MRPLRTATVTWISWNNYGSLLQAYALQQSIRKLGCRNRILCDEAIISKLPTLRQRIIRFLSIIKHRNIKRSAYLFEKFRRLYLSIDHSHNLRSQNNRYEAFICGSDQIWSTYLAFEPYYYLHYFNRRKIAYAPSTATHRFSTDYLNAILPELRQFESLSLREQLAAEALSAASGLQVDHVADPTILLQPEEWRKLIPRHPPSGKYILCYFLSPGKWYMDWVKAYAERHGLTIRIFDTRKEYADYGECISAGPREFLSYIDSASMVFTDSYHATIFSILLHKNFVTFKRFTDGEGIDQNERIYALFRKLSLTPYFIGQNELPIVESLPTPDYAEIDKVLEQWRSESLSYLKNALFPNLHGNNMPT